MKKRPFKRKVKDFFLTVLAFFGIILVIYVPKFFIARHFQRLREEINPPFDFDAATKQIQRMQEQEREKQKRQDKTNEPIGPTKPKLQEVEPDLPPDPASLPGATTPNKKTSLGPLLQDVQTHSWLSLPHKI
jgi:hypothetical protein